MLANTLTLKDIDNVDVTYTRVSQSGTSEVYKDLSAPLGADRSINIDHKLTGKAPNQVRNTRIRITNNKVDATTKVPGSVNGTIQMNVPQSGAVINDDDVEQIIALLRSALKEGTAGAAMTVPFAEVLKEGSL